MGRKQEETDPTVTTIEIEQPAPAPAPEIEPVQPIVIEPPAPQVSEPNANERATLDLIREAVQTLTATYQQSLQTLTQNYQQAIEQMRLAQTEYQTATDALVQALDDLDPKIDNLGLVAQALTEVAEQLRPTKQ